MRSNEIVRLQEEASTIRLFWKSFIIILPGFSFGLSNGYAAIAQPFYKHPNETTLETPLSEEGVSWFVSTLPLALTCGALVSGFLSESLGRRRTLILSNLFQLVGWTGIFFSSNLSHLIMGRIINGFGSGLSVSCSYNLLGEISLVRFRGLLYCMNNVSTSVGMMVVMFLGFVFDFSLVVPLSTIPSWLFLLLTFELPESPLWLVKRGREKESLDMLEKIRGYGYSGMQVEMNELVFCACRNDEKVSLSDKVRYMSSGPVLKPFALALCLMFFQVASGIECISNYPLDILERSKVTMDKFAVALALQMVSPVGYIIAMPMLYRMPRKVQFCLSCLALFFVLALFATCMYLKEHFPSNLTSFVELLIPLSFITITFFYSVGMGPVGFGLLGELFPPNATEICSGISIMFRSLASALFLKVFPWLVNNLGLPLLFSLYALVALVSILFMVSLVPETQGLTLTQLSQLFTSEPPVRSEIRGPKTAYLEKDQNPGKAPGPEICSA